MDKPQMTEFQVPEGYVLVPLEIEPMSDTETKLRLTSHNYSSCPTNGTTTWVGHSHDYVVQGNDITLVRDTQKGRFSRGQ